VIFPLLALAVAVQITLIVPDVFPVPGCDPPDHGVKSRLSWLMSRWYVVAIRTVTI